MRSAGIGRWHWSSKAKRFSADPTARRLLRLSGNDWNPEQFWNAFSAEGAAGAERFRRFVAAGDDDGAFEWDARVGLDGDARWLRLHGTLVQGGSSGILVDGILISRATSSEDILALDRQLAGVVEQEDRFRLAIDMIPQIVWSTLPDGHHDYYNRRWYAFTGMKPGSTDGEGWAELFHPDDREKAWPLWRHSLATGDPFEVEYRLRAADGSYKWTLGRALPIRDDKGAIIRWFGTCTDIHDKKRLEENQELLSRELSHRIKNIFAVVAALLGIGARSRPEASRFAAEMRERIGALGRAHNYARPHSEDSRPFDDEATLFGLLREIMAPYPQLQDGRIALYGDDLPVADRAATPVSLLFHELATNAVKHGSLSTLEGKVVITCRKMDQNQVHILWQESGGPPIDGEPAAIGFGTRLAQMSVERQLGGRMERVFPPEGFTFEATIPRDSLSLPH